MHIQQAIYGAHGPGGYHFLARSPGFAEGWLPEAERLCTGVGDRPGGVTCPLAVFAQPFGRDHVAVVQMADQGRDDAGRPGALAFRLLIVPTPLYHGIDSDPFLLSERYPPDWSARGDLPVLEWEGGPPPRRTVADLKHVLNVAPDVTAALLGGVQVLIDGGRLAFERKAPAPQLVQGLWALLPSSNRRELWPATFAFGNALGFHIVALPDRKAPGLEGHANGDEAGDYPEGRYEYAIQKAVEDEDQEALDSLLARRSRSQMLRMGIVLLLAFLVIPPLILGLPLGPREDRPPAKKSETDAPAPAPDRPLALPDARDLPQLGDQERRDLAERLARLTAPLGAPPPAGPGDKELGAALADLDARIDATMGDRRPPRRTGPLAELGPPRRRLMALAWKHGVADYADTRLNAVELAERLEAKLRAAGALPGGQP